MTAPAPRRNPTSALLILAVTLGVAAGLTQSTDAAKFNRKVDIGDAAPAWKDLTGTDGKQHSLSDLAKAKAVVVVFTCNHCPVARFYEDRFNQLVADYKKKDVQLVAISCSLEPTDTLDKMKERAEKQNFAFPYLQDPSQEIGRAYGATATPQVFVLDARRHIAYMGAFDDSMNPAKVETRYVRDALDAVLNNKTPEIRETRQFGCSIGYK